MSDTAALGISLLLLGANAWFVVFEFSLVRMRATRLEELEARGVRNAAAARRMHGRMNDYLGACQVGITSASLAIGWLAEPAFGALIEPAFGALSHKVAAAAAFSLITVLHIVVGEQVPKAAAIQMPERALLWSVTPMRVFFVVFFVPLRVLNAIVNLTLRAIGLSVRPHEEPSLSTEEIRLAVTEGYRQGEVSLDRSLLVENALDFDTMVVKEAMVPIGRAATLDLEAPAEEQAWVMKTRGLSRYLVRDGQRFVGYVHVKDLGFRPGAPLAELLRPLPTVAGTMPLNRLLRRMQRDRTHIALVMGEADAPIGVVTLEDLLEKLVGEIHDEFEAVRVWNLADHVDAGAVDLELRPSGRDQAIRALLERITRASPEIHGEATVQAVLRREALAPTAVGQGVALPHARLPGLQRTHVAIARLPEPIVWTPAADPVRFIFLILTPAETPSEQNRALMRVASLVHDDLLFARLDEAPTPDALVEVVRAADAVA
jgi:CBS domain containing-hemolysin-like protein/mannitol/fructose-specific phosphotransferase system IIA component (Ntr-type)